MKQALCYTILAVSLHSPLLGCIDERATIGSIRIGPSQVLCYEDVTYVVVQYERWSSNPTAGASPTARRSWVRHAVLIAPTSGKWTVQCSLENADATLVPHMSTICVKDGVLFTVEPNRVYRWTSKGFVLVDTESENELIQSVRTRVNDVATQSGQRLKHYSTNEFPFEFDCNKRRLRFELSKDADGNKVTVRSLNGGDQSAELFDQAWKIKLDDVKNGR